MRIGFFVWEYPPGISGELGIYAENISRELIDMGHDISVFTKNNGELKTREVIRGVDVNRPMLIDGSNILPLFITEDLRKWDIELKFFNDVFIYNVLSATKFVNELIKKEGYEFDIICAHDWLSAIAGLMIKKELGLPFVFHFHSTGWGRKLDGGSDSETVMYIEESAANAADGIITVSYPMQEDLIRHGIEAEKIRVCWNGVSTELYDPNRLDYSVIEELRNGYGISTEDKMILFVGRLTPAKGIVNLVKAMPTVISRHPEVKLVILGRGELEKTILDLISRLGIADNVKPNFIFVSEEERILHYGACDIAVFPSLYEPSGIVALEAMAMAKPVVVGARGISGFRDLVIPSGHDQTGIHVDGSNSADIAWGINSLLENPEAAKAMGERGRVRVERYFTWDRTAKCTIDVYEEIIR
ncbi:MAG: glycosyltransferase family 4 protein [Methanophagales archaeon]|nr:glycosyltransferase family 4 protein [Methanophagales archaeon]